MAQSHNQVPGAYVVLAELLRDKRINMTMFRYMLTAMYATDPPPDQMSNDSIHSPPLPSPASTPTSASSSGSVSRIGHQRPAAIRICKQPYSSEHMSRGTANAIRQEQRRNRNSTAANAGFVPPHPHAQAIESNAASPLASANLQAMDNAVMFDRISSITSRERGRYDENAMEIQRDASDPSNDEVIVFTATLLHRTHDKLRAIQQKPRITSAVKIHPTAGLHEIKRVTVQELTAFASKNKAKSVPPFINAQGIWVEADLSDYSLFFKDQQPPADVDPLITRDANTALRPWCQSVRWERATAQTLKLAKIQVIGIAMNSDVPSSLMIPHPSIPPPEFVDD